MKIKRNPLLSVLFGSLLSVAGPAAAAEDLTPIGAQRQSNTDSSIPAWDGGMAASAVQKDERGGYRDPFADEQPLFVIDARNFKEHAQWLSKGQVAMFVRYPDYRMPVYPSHRTAQYPDKVYEASLANQGKTSLTSTNGLRGYRLGVPFRKPENGPQILWNQLTRYKGGSQDRTFSFALVRRNGTSSSARIRTELSYPEMLRNAKPGDDLFMAFKSKILEPSKLAGEAVVIRESFDPDVKQRATWMYNASLRRVTRAPAAMYEYVARMTNGLVMSDTVDGFNGTLNYYDWKLKGKQELYIPYNSFRLADRRLRYRDILTPQHINTQYTRYEKHRVWVLEGNLNPGGFTKISKRVMYLDEDTWSVAAIDMYVGDKVVRLYESHAMPFPDLAFSFEAMSTYYNLAGGDYAVNHMTNEETRSMRVGFPADVADFTPTAIKRWVNN